MFASQSAIVQKATKKDERSSRVVSEYRLTYKRHVLTIHLLCVRKCHSLSLGPAHWPATAAARAPVRDNSLPLTYSTSSTSSRPPPGLQCPQPTHRSTGAAPDPHASIQHILSRLPRARLPSPTKHNAPCSTGRQEKGSRGGRRPTTRKRSLLTPTRGPRG